MSQIQKEYAVNS